MSVDHNIQDTYIIKEAHDMTIFNKVVFLVLRQYSNLSCSLKNRFFDASAVTVIDSSLLIPSTSSYLKQ